MVYIVFTIANTAVSVNIERHPLRSRIRQDVYYHHFYLTRT